MNTPSPLVPQGTFQDKGKSHVRITVFAILAIHVVLLGVLLIAGCNKKATPETEMAENSVVPPVPAPPVPEQWPTPGQASPQNNNADIPPVPPPVPPPITQGSPETTFAPAPAPITPEPIQPDPVPVPMTPEVAPMTEHTIAKGETLSTIGKRYGVGYKSIEAANPGINPTRLRIGDKIKIPAPKAPSATSALAPAPNGGSASARTYVVKSGDNLLKIAKLTGTTVKQLRAANNLRTDQIRVGQKLKIPVQSPPPEAIAPPPVAPPTTPLGPQ